MISRWVNTVIPHSVRVTQCANLKNSKWFYSSIPSSIKYQSLAFTVGQIPDSSYAYSQVPCNDCKAPSIRPKLNNFCLERNLYRINRTRLSYIFRSIKSEVEVEISRIRAATRSNNYIVLYLKENILIFGTNRKAIR